MGKKWSLTPDHLATVKRLAEQGVTEANIARAIGLHPSTFSEKKRVHPELDDIIKTAQASGEAFAAGIVREIMNDPNHRQRLTATIFYLKTRHRWREAEVALPESTSTPDGFTFTLVNVPEGT